MVSCRNRALVLVLVLTSFVAGCSSVEIVRLQPDLLHTPRGTEPLAAIQVTTMGFFLFTLGLPEADLDKAVNELLLKEARKIGADKVINLRFDVTPSHGIWFLTKLLWFRVATAWGVAVVSRPEGGEDEDLWAKDGADGAGAQRARKPPPATRPTRRNERESSVPARSPAPPASVPAVGP